MRRIKISLTIALLTMASIICAKNPSFYIKGGLNMSNLYGDKLSNKDVKPCFHGGVGLDFEFTTNLSLQTGLYFSSKGADYTTSLSDEIENVKYSVTANYLQLPIYFAYKIDITPDARLFLHTGPYLAYGVGGKRNIESGFTDDRKEYFGKQEINTFDNEYGYKPFDIGVGVGAGVELGIIFINLGWDMGLNNIARNIKGIPSYKPTKKNRSTYLSIGYKF